MEYGELKQHIDGALMGSEEFSPVYVVFGEDDYLRAQAIKLLKSVVDEDFAAFNFSQFSADGGVRDAIDTLYTYPVFGQYRAVVLTVGQKLADEDKEAIKAYLSSPSESSIFIVDCDADTAKSIKGKAVKSVDCSTLKSDALIPEIKKLCAEEPARSIDNAAADELIVRTQGSMSRIASELVKLKAYCDETIKLADVREMVTADLDFQIYELTSAVSEKNANKAFQVLDVFYKNGIRPMRIINQLYDRYRKMLHAELNKGLSNDDVGKLLGMKGGAVYHMRRVSSEYSQVRLKKSVDYLHSLQCDVLTGRCSENTALKQAMFELLSI
ncbi:MAG: DNA polymerase III subunit delta [Clostridia bacterium]|nr:DNA polymerase III subunit delta [Clostridia bacterium]